MIVLFFVFFPRVTSRQSVKKKSVLRKGFALVFSYLEVCACTCSIPSRHVRLLVSLGVLLLFVSGPSVPFPSLQRIS